MAAGQDLPVRQFLRPSGLARPLGLARRTARRSGVWAVSMVKDEADIVAYTVEHLIAQGVDHVLIADNDSTDGTGDVLRDLARRHPVLVVDDRVVAYYQAQKMTRLARVAFALGAEWIIPFDADELWCAGHAAIGEVLRRTELDVVYAPMYHYSYLGAEGAEPNPYLRQRWRVDAPSGPKKAAFRSHRFAFVNNGNHTVRRPGVSGPGLHIHHFPHRGHAQMATKLANGSAAFAASDLPADVGAHWRVDDVLDLAEAYRARAGVVEDPAPFGGRPCGLSAHS